MSEASRSQISAYSWSGVWHKTDQAYVLLEADGHSDCMRLINDMYPDNGHLELHTCLRVMVMDMPVEDR